MYQSMHPKQVLLVCLAMLFATNVCVRDLVAQQPKLCQAAVGAWNKQFTTTNGLDKSGNLPLDSGLIVHTIHGAAELNMKQLNALPVEATKTCGTFMNAKIPVFLPWCGSNQDPVTHKWDDSSSWTYIRQDTLIHGANQRPDEVVCDDSNNKKYGLIFSNAYMNARDNLGCMYPLDGDTGNRTKMGCGISQNPIINKTDAQGACPTTETLVQYDADFQNLLSNPQQASYAGSLICSLSKPQFDLWVGARKSIDLSYTAWPVDEFVLFNWDTYSTSSLASNKYLVGIYYLTGCIKATDGNRKDAQAIADLYKKWSGVDVPVVNLSNSAMRAKSSTPFSCL
jgi:hypothetical protein